MPTECVAVRLNLSDSQVKKFVKAADSFKEKQDFDEVAIKVSKKNIDNEKGIELKLTKTQYNKLIKSDSIFVMKFSKTQLKNQGSGIWDILMSIGRKVLPVIKAVIAVGKKVFNTNVGKVITKLGSSAAEGAISGATQYAVTDALSKRAENSTPQETTNAAPENTVSGGSITLKIDKDAYEKTLQIYECLRDKKILKKIFTYENYKIIKYAHNVIKNKNSYNKTRWRILTINFKCIKLIIWKFAFRAKRRSLQERSSRIRFIIRNWKGIKKWRFYKRL